MAQKIVPPPIKNAKWINRHGTVDSHCEQLCNVHIPDGTEKTIIRDMKATALALQQIVQDAMKQGKRIRCYGGKWSLSDCAFTQDWMIATTALNLYWPPGKKQIATTYKGDINGLYLVQCGMTVQDVNTVIESDGRALRTSGASNGQTIAGAIATGTHGSAFKYGSMTEFVVGIQLITGDDIIWLERKSYPVITDAFAADLGITVIKRNNDLFNAALVSFGSFGITAAVMIETVPVYMLEMQRQRLTFDKLGDCMNTLNLTSLQSLPHPGEEPWHFEITFNPHDIVGGGYVRTGYERPFTEHDPPAAGEGVLGPGEGFLSVVGSLTNMVNDGLVAFLMGVLIQKQLIINGKPDTGTPAEVFTTTFLQGKAMSMEIGIDIQNSTRVLDMMRNLPEKSVYAGVISYRWVKQSSALLGFTKFPVTATIEFNAAANDRTLNFYNAVWMALENAGIAYTLHWGQMNNFTPQRVVKMYGKAAVNKWKKCRQTLLSAAAQKVFSSDFLTKTGLG